MTPQPALAGCAALQVEESASGMVGCCIGGVLPPLRGVRMTAVKSSAKNRYATRLNFSPLR